MATVLPWSFRELMSMATLATYLDKPSGEAARKWAKRHGVPLTVCGRELRADKRDVDAAMKAQTRKAS